MGRREWNERWGGGGEEEGGNERWGGGRGNGRWQLQREKENGEEGIPARTPPLHHSSAIRRGGHTHLGALSEHRESIIFIRNLYESLPSSSAGNPGHRERTHTRDIIRLPLANACLVWVLSWVMSAALKLCPMQTCDTPPGNQGGIHA